jgi:hypothetical protein
MKIPLFQTSQELTNLPAELPICLEVEKGWSNVIERFAILQTPSKGAFGAPAKTKFAG